MKRGIIITNAYARLTPAINQTARLVDEFARLGVEAVPAKACGSVFVGGNGRIANGFAGYDFCVYLDKDRYASRLLEKSGMRLFNSHAAVQACDDKMETHILLAENGVPMPATISAPLCYTPSADVDEELINSVERELGYPVIVKKCYGSRGECVYKADDREELLKLAEKLKCVPHLFQKCITESLGKDVRVIVIGGKVVAAMLRQSGGDFRSNIDLGGRGEKYDIPHDMRGLCEKVASILGLDYCGIDVLIGKDGYFICEVNSNAFFSEIERVTGVNVARAYAEHICRVIYG